jgi:hypothetical protein
MDNSRSVHLDYSTIGWSALSIWWGIVIMLDPLTLGMGAIGTGLILLGVNAARSRNGVPTKGSTTVVGVIALVWGGLDQVGSMLNKSGAAHLPPELSFALLLIVIGLVLLADKLLDAGRTSAGEAR